MVSKKSQKSNKPAKKGPNSNLEGDRLRQKNRIPEKIRQTVGDDRKCRNLFLSWGVNTVGEEAQPFTPEAEQTYHRRKQRDGELKTARAQGSGTAVTGKNKATGRNNPSTNGSSEPIISIYTTAAPTKPPMLPPPEPVSHGTFHEWSLDSPSSPGSIPAAATRRNSPPTPTYHTMRGPSYYPPQTSTRAQRIVYGHVVDEVVELKYPYTAAPTTGSTGPESPCADRDTSASHSPPTTPSLDTDIGSSSTYSSLPPSPVWIDAPGFDAARPPAPIAAGSTPPLSDVQDSEERKDVFSAVYQESFMRRSSDSRCPSPQPPAPIPGTSYTHTPQPQLVNHQLQHYQGYPPESALIDNAFGTSAATCATESVEQGCRDIARWSYAAHTAQSEGGEPMVWSSPSFHAAHAEAGRSDYTADDAHAHGNDIDVQSSLVAQWTTYAIHSSPPAMRSSHSELAQALHFSPRGFTDAGALSTTDSPSLHTHFSGIDTLDDVPLALAYPQDAAISIDECARLIDECYDANEHLLSEVSSLLADIALPAGQHYDTFY